MKGLALLLLSLLCGPAFAQAPEPCPCAPFENSERYYAIVLGHNLFGGPGPWLRWGCYAQPVNAGPTPDPPRYCTIAQPWGVIDIRKLGDRIETIRSSADPLAAFRSSWSRHVTLPLADPSLAPLRAAIAAQPASAASSPAAP